MISRYIKMLAKASLTPQHEMILECLEYYGVYGTRELTEEQLKEFIVKRRTDNEQRIGNGKRSNENHGGGLHIKIINQSAENGVNEKER